MEIIGGASGPTAIYVTDSVICNNVAFSFAGYIVTLVILCLIAYFIGNMSPSTILAKRRGLNIKEEGSGNAGTTNALRVMGKRAGVITLVIDILKGTLASLIGLLILGHFGSACCALAVVLGHIWPLAYKFQGGKGVATVFGAVLPLNPILALMALGVVAIFVFASKRMSVGSLAGAVFLPIGALFLEPVFFPHAVVMAVVVIIKHRANVVRLIHREEPVMSIFEKKK